jgi:hypothetical protein
MQSWVALFGEPQRVSMHFDLPHTKWESSWEQQLPNGPLQCVGCIFERSPGIQWIIVKQLKISQPSTGVLNRPESRRASISNSTPSPISHPQGA